MLDDSNAILSGRVDFLTKLAPVVGRAWLGRLKMVGSMGSDEMQRRLVLITARVSAVGVP